MIIRVWHCGHRESEERCTAEKPGHFASPQSKRRSPSIYCYGIDKAVRCDHDGCMNEFELKDDRFSPINASSKLGWFLRQDETLHLCFDHLTIEIIAWRDWKNPGWRGRLARGLASKLPSVEEAKGVARRRQVGYTGTTRPSEPTRGGGDEQRQS